jgi:hypothetical protein
MSLDSAPPPAAARFGAVPAPLVPVCILAIDGSESTLPPFAFGLRRNRFTPSNGADNVRRRRQPAHSLLEGVEDRRLPIRPRQDGR